MKENNVVLFPSKKKNTPPQSVDDIVVKVNENKQIFARYLAQSIYVDVINQMHEEGLEFDIDTISNVLLMANVIESTCFRAVGLEHDYNELADTVLEIENKEDVLNELYRMLNEE